LAVPTCTALAPTSRNFTASAALATELQGFVKDGTIEAIAVQSAYQMGALGVKTAIEVVEGKSVPKFRDTGVLMVTRKNIDSTEAKNVLY